MFSITKENFHKFFLEAPEAMANFELQLAPYHCSLRAIIHNADGLDCFTQFLRTEHSAENVEFWLAVRRFRHLASSHTQGSSTDEAVASAGSAEMSVSSSTRPLLIDDVHSYQNEYTQSLAALRRQSEPPPLTAELNPKKYAQVLEAAQHIVAAFISMQAPQQVNIDAQQRQIIEEQVASGHVTVTTFSMAEQEILALMERDSFNRFKQSAIFRDFVSCALHNMTFSTEPSVSTK